MIADPSLPLEAIQLGSPRAAAASAPEGRHSLQRRHALALTLALAGSALCSARAGPARAEEAATALTPAASDAQPAAAVAATASAPALREYANAAQGFRLQVPASWEQKDKAGAVVLFEDPDRRSTSVGVTVNPVKVRLITDFGGVSDVGAKLLDAERRKDGFLSVALVAESSTRGGSGALLYQYEYELESTRGRKRILNTVTIFNSRLYILNGAFKCDKQACSAEALQAVQVLRDMAASFDVTA